MVVDLRVDDSADPLGALGDLLVTRAATRTSSALRAGDQRRPRDGRPGAGAAPAQDPATEPDQLMWRAVVAALAGREDAARAMLAELVAGAPQFLEAARRFGKAGLMPADVIDRIVPPAPVS